MNVLVIGSGGREHAIVKKIKENNKVEKLYALPGNGGMANDAECVDIGVMEFEKIKDFATEHKIDFAVVTPDDPLAGGLVDCLNGVGIKCFGPDKKAAVIEASKAFAKNLMKKYGIPTADYEVFTDVKAALDYLDICKIPVVLKADGLALGKGVIIAQSKEEAKTAVIDMMQNGKFGKSGNTVVIEEFITGPEVSVLSFTDGNTVVPMVSSMDHKRIGDNDTGLNTGGMGTIAPNPYYTEEISKICMEKIFIPTINAMKSEGRTFRGCLYFGLMLTDNGPKVIEYNCRFGDPETQVVLPLMESDLLTVMQKTSDGTLNEEDVKFKKESAACVVMASKGYPQSYEKGYEITVESNIDAQVYVAGATLKNGRLVTSGGRVLGVTAVASDLKNAIEKAYAEVEKVKFGNAYYRKDIGKKALACSEEM